MIARGQAPLVGVENNGRRQLLTWRVMDGMDEDTWAEESTPATGRHKTGAR